MIRDQTQRCKYLSREVITLIDPVPATSVKPPFLAPLTYLKKGAKNQIVIIAAFGKQRVDEL